MSETTHNQKKSPEICERLLQEMQSKKRESGRMKERKSEEKRGIEIITSNQITRIKEIASNPPAACLPA
jgi:hypothetical protein